MKNWVSELVTELQASHYCNSALLHIQLFHTALSTEALRLKKPEKAL